MAKSHPLNRLRIRGVVGLDLLLTLDRKLEGPTTSQLAKALLRPICLRETLTETRWSLPIGMERLLSTALQPLARLRFAPKVEMIRFARTELARPIHNQQPLRS